MPIVGLGVHFLVAIYFAVHAVRTGQQTYWLFILFSFPVLGSIVYFIVIYLPDSRLERGARKAVAAAARALDPTRELREARAAFDYTPTAENQLRLAAALFAAGDAAEAAKHYEACLQGPFAGDGDIRLKAARAQLACENYVRAIEHLETLRRDRSDFRPDQVALLLAEALSASGCRDAARSEYEAALERFGSFEVRAEFAIWAALNGEREIADRLEPEVERTIKHWGRHNRELNAPLIRRLNAAYSAMRETR